MQFIKKTSSRTSIVGVITKINYCLAIIVLGIVFLLNKIDFPAQKRN